MGGFKYVCYPEWQSRWLKQMLSLLKQVSISTCKYVVMLVVFIKHLMHRLMFCQHWKFGESPLTGQFPKKKQYWLVKSELIKIKLDNFQAATWSTSPWLETKLNSVCEWRKKLFGCTENILVTYRFLLKSLIHVHIYFCFL